MTAELSAAERAAYEATWQRAPDQDDPSRPIARTTIAAVCRALGYRPHDVVSIRIRHEAVDVAVLDDPEGERPTRTITHRIREDR